MMPMRQLTVSDIFEFVPLYQSIFPEKNITKEKIHAIFTNEPATVFVVESGQRLVGFSYFLTILDEMEIIDFGVSENFRKQGIGKMLMQHAINHAQEKDIKKIFLEVRADNAAAIHLYESLGFCFVRKRENYYQDGCVARLYEMILSPH